MSILWGVENRTHSLTKPVTVNTGQRNCAVCDTDQILFDDKDQLLIADCSPRAKSAHYGYLGLLSKRLFRSADNTRSLLNMLFCSLCRGFMCMQHAAIFAGISACWNACNYCNVLHTIIACNRQLHMKPRLYFTMFTRDRLSRPPTRQLFGPVHYAFYNGLTVGAACGPQCRHTPAQVSWLIDCFFRRKNQGRKSSCKDTP